MKKNIFISLNYAPGLLKEMLAISKELGCGNNDFLLYLAKDYKWMIDKNSNVEFCKFLMGKFGKLGQLLDIPFVSYQIFKVLRRYKFNSCIIYNISIFNSIVFLIAYLFRTKKRVLFLHEPFKEKSDVNGLLVKFYFYLAELVQSIPIKLSTHVVLLSPNGRSIFDLNFKKYKGVVVESNLIIPDYNKLISAPKKRKYYTVIGRFNKIKKIDYFLDFVSWSVNKNLNNIFLIITSSDIKRKIESLPDKTKEKIILVNPQKLSDESIFNALRESKGVLLMQPVITQSGVLPFSFMSGTPVIALNNPGFAQYVNNGINGMLIDNPNNYDQIQASIEFLESNYKNLSNEARKTYLDKFHPKNVQSLLSSII